MQMDELVENAFVVSLSKEQRRNYCAHCLKNASTRTCGKCHWAKYCSPKCFKEDWMLHKYECASIERRGDMAHDGIRLVMRLAVYWRTENYGDVDVEGETRSLRTLESHDDKMKEASEQFLLDYRQFEAHKLVPDDIIKLLYRKVSINSFGVSNGFGSLIGIALCIKLSKANHSCNPMARVTFQQRKCKLVPTGLRPVRSGNLIAVTHSYIDELQPLETRRKLLKEKYQFDCECNGCNDDERNARMESWTCGVCVDGMVRNEENASCNLCGWQLEPEKFLSNSSTEASVIDSNRLLNDEKTPLAERVKIAEKLEETCKNSLHKHNVLRLPLLRTIYGSAVIEKRLGTAVEYGLKLLELQQQYQKPHDMAILYHKNGLAQVMLAHGAKESALELLEQIKRPMTKVFGEEAIVVKQLHLMIKMCRE